MLKPKNALGGFTIVELLIVVVVIGILAAITIVTYRGIQMRAMEAVLVSDLSGAAKQLEHMKQTSQYPSTDNDLKKSSSVTFYYAHNPSENSYCLTGESSNNNISKYFVSNTQFNPQQGECPAVTDVWAMSTVEALSEHRCTSSCAGSFLLQLNNYSYVTGTVTEFEGGMEDLFQLQYSCAGATCSGVTYTITAQAPFEIAEEGSTNWGQSITRSPLTYSWGASSSASFKMRVSENAPSGSAQIYVSSASSTNSNLRMYSSQRITMTK